jgi:hypothetical protein
MPFPINTSPLVYSFRLHLDELYQDNSLLNKVIFTTSFSSVSVVPTPNFQLISAGTNEAIGYAKSLQTSETYYASIPTSVLSPEIVLSRQLPGTKFQLFLDDLTSSTIQSFSVMVGMIGKVSMSGSLVKLELVSYNERLKSRDLYKVSSSCMNTLGELKCTVPNPVTVLPVGSVTDNNIVNVLIPFPRTSSQQYELVVGTTSYIVDPVFTNPDSIKIIGNIQGTPQLVKMKLHCNGTIQQCSLYNNLSQFNGSVMLASSISNTSL